MSLSAPRNGSNPDIVQLVKRVPRFNDVQKPVASRSEASDLCFRPASLWRWPGFPHEALPVKPPLALVAITVLNETMFH